MRANGSLVKTFGNRGIVISDPTDASDEPRALSLQGDGSIIVVGSAQLPDAVRYTSSGALDTTFGNGGVSFTYVSTGYGQFNAVVPRTGSVIAAGVTNGDVLLAAYLTS